VFISDNSGGAFTKTGGVIYGKAGNRALDNEATGEGYKGHAVFWLQNYNTREGKWINGDHADGALSVEEGESGSDWDPQVTGVTVSTPVLSAARGNAVQCGAVVACYRDEDPAVTWQLNGVPSPGVTAGGSSIDANGLLSVGANETAPALTVTAVSVANPWVSGSKTVTVVAAAVTRTLAGLYIGESVTPVDLSGYTVILDIFGNYTDIPDILGKALQYIRANAVNDTLYTIVLGEDAVADSVLSAAALNNARNVGITLEGLGTERTVTNKNGLGIFGINSANGVTLTLGNNITLKGRTNGVDGATSDGKGSLVSVYGNGKLVMVDGSKITGQTLETTSNSKGAGVTVDGGGTFEMRGGEISGNTITGKNCAGGAYIASGSFVMSGGVIRGNTAIGSGFHAGGVGAGRNFQKTGGIIYGVTPGREGYNAADDNTAAGAGTTKANAVLWVDTASVAHSIDGDLIGNFPEGQ
jgi:hypothetical protein